MTGRPESPSSLDSLEGAEITENDNRGRDINVRQDFTQNDAFYMQRMVEMLVADGRRRDDMFERVLRSVTPQTTIDHGNAQNSQAFHVMPDMSKVIGYFDGDKDIQKTEDWIKSIERAPFEIDGQKTTNWKQQGRL